jgi:hypothetical protein
MISIKIYEQGENLVVGACDENLLGKKFIEGKFKIDVSKNFYEGKRVNKDALVKYLNEATIANLVGEEVVNCAIKHGLINPERILKIKGIPHAQLVKIF